VRALEPDPREHLAVAAILATWVVLVLVAVKGHVLFSRPLWLDECFTVLVANHRSLVAVFSDLRHGADGGASLFHLVVWLLRANGGAAALMPVPLRILSLLFVLGAMQLTYVTLRRAFSAPASIAGALAVGANVAVVAHAFEARFYALWLLCGALVAWSLGVERHRAWKLALASILLVTSHWYGVISLGILGAAAVVSQGRSWRSGLRSIAPMASGLVALLAVSPLALGQRATITVNSQIPDFSPDQLLPVLRVYWLAPLVLIVVAALGAALLADIIRHRASAVVATAARVRDPSVAALLALAVMPLAIVVLSAVGQPSMNARYPILAALAWAPLVAILADTLPARTRIAVPVLVALSWLSPFRREAAQDRAFAAEVRHNAAVLHRAEAMHLPFAFQYTNSMYPLAINGYADPRRLRYLALPDSVLFALYPRRSARYQLNKFRWLQRDFARVHAARFGFPVLVTPTDLDTLPAFVLIALPPPTRHVEDVSAFARALFPRRQVTLLAPNLLLLRTSGDSRHARNTFRLDSTR
jgi:hypothetical protein